MSFSSTLPSASDRASIFSCATRTASRSASLTRMTLRRTTSFLPRSKVSGANCLSMSALMSARLYLAIGWRTFRDVGGPKGWKTGGQPVRQVAAPRVRGSTRVQNGGCVSDLFLFDREEVLIDPLEQVHRRRVRQLQNRRPERHNAELLDVQLDGALTLNGHTRSPEAQVRLAVPDDDQEGDL